MPDNSFKSFIGKIKKSLSSDLPGLEAQYLMAPYKRLSTHAYLNMPNIEPRKGCVLILLYQMEGEICTVLTKRNEYKGAHSGQISFPGGKFDDSDKELAYTAIRETKEEIGISPKDIQLIGELTHLYIPVSNFLVYPFVGYIDSYPQFILNEREVAELIPVKLKTLVAASKNAGTKKIQTSSDLIITAPYYDIHGHHIWGATAMIISEFVAVIERT
jgi:8-oxo-dGTP pyrophosphatase MutT (NUDIX family)